MLAAAALRLGLLAIVVTRGGVDVLNRGDTLSYLIPGRNLILHGSFAEAGLPDIARTPGYAIFLAFFSFAGPVAVALVQVTISVISVLLVWRLGQTVCEDAKISITAAWIFAFEPLSITYSILLLSETLFLALFLLSLIQLAEFIGRRQLPGLVAVGCWLAAATFVRPVTYYLAGALAAGLFLALVRVPRLRWKAPAVLLISVLPWLAVWQIRNQVETGFAGFSSIEAHNLYFFSAGEVKATVEHRSLDQVDADLGYDDVALFVSTHPGTDGWSESHRLLFMRSQAGQVIRAHPWVFLRTHVQGMIRTVFNPGAAVPASLLGMPVDGSTFVREQAEGPGAAAWQAVTRFPLQTALMAALAGILLGTYIFALLGALRWSAPSALLWLLLGVVAYFFAVSGGAVGEARFRLPVMPIICILAATGVVCRKRNPESSHAR